MNFSLSERDNQRAIVVAQFHIPCLNAKLYIPLRNHYSDLQPLLNLIMFHSSVYIDWSLIAAMLFSSPKL